MAIEMKDLTFEEYLDADSGASSLRQGRTVVGVGKTQVEEDAASRLAEDLKGVKRIVMIQWFILAVIIICGGMVFGVQNDRWLDAATYIAVLLVVSRIFAQLMYWRAKQRMLNPAFSVYRSE